MNTTPNSSSFLMFLSPAVMVISTATAERSQQVIEYTRQRMKNGLSIQSPGAMLQDCELTLMDEDDKEKVC